MHHLRRTFLVCVKKLGSRVRWECGLPIFTSCREGAFSETVYSPGPIVVHTRAIMSVILWPMDEPGAAAPLEEKALEVLQAAVADARGQPGVHVSRAQVMQQAGGFELEEFLRIAEYLAG